LNLGVRIPAKTLRDRLPPTLIVAEQRERKIHGMTSEAEINRVLQSYADFVEQGSR
jgi:hypothetical protein